MHIGGDQLTRERFSGAKRLRKDAITEEERFEHLSPITFELFHLQMTLLTMFYKLLYKKDSFEKGTLHGEKIRLSRTEANGDDVKNHFDHCKELAVSLIDSYIVSAALEYFAETSVIFVHRKYQLFTTYRTVAPTMSIQICSNRQQQTSSYGKSEDPPGNTFD